MLGVLLGQLCFCALGGGLGYLLVRHSSPVAEFNVPFVDPVGNALGRSDWKTARRPLVSVSRAAVLAVGVIIMLAAAAGAIAAVLLALGYIE